MNHLKFLIFCAPLKCQQKSNLWARAESEKKFLSLVLLCARGISQVCLKHTTSSWKKGENFFWLVIIISSAYKLVVVVVANTIVGRRSKNDEEREKVQFRAVSLRQVKVIPARITAKSIAQSAQTHATSNCNHEQSLARFFPLLLLLRLLVPNPALRKLRKLKRYANDWFVH